MISGYMVFWVDNAGPKCQYFGDNEMSDALAYMNQLRQNEDNQFVTFASQNTNSIGKPGVDSIVDGMLPDGSKYTWMKRRSQ